MKIKGITTNKKQLRRCLTMALALLLPLLALADIPPRPTDRKIVHDYANVINDIEEARMEDSLKLFAEQTGNEIAVVTVSDLDGMSRSEYAAELGQKWGVGIKGKDNGIVVLVKPKTERSRGEAIIATGYGLEGALPDALCADIVNDRMIPRFKENDYTGGIWAALNIIMPIARGEYNEQQYYNDNDGEVDVAALIFLIIFIAIIVILLSKDAGGGSGGSRTYTGGPIIFGNSSGSSWSSGGYSSGGWGGFSGGSFGGGGGGGSW